MATVDRYTIEPAKDGDGFWLVAHGTYEESSVLAGQPRWMLCRWYATIEEATIRNPNVEILDHVTDDRINLPEIAPDWFDPTNAGEVWHEDDY